MLHRRTERSISPGGVVLLAVLGTYLAGCATTVSTPEPLATQASTSVVPTTPARIEPDGEHGFTVVEAVHITSDVRDTYQDAVLLLQQDRVGEGIALLESVVASAPDVTAPHIDLGIAYGRIGELDKAEEALRTALTLTPDHPAALNELGIVYRRTGRFELARESYEGALRVHPSYHYALRNLGVLCDLYLEDLACALAQYESYQQIVADDEEVAMWISDVRNRLNVSQ